MVYYHKTEAANAAFSVFRTSEVEREVLVKCKHWERPVVRISSSNLFWEADLNTPSVLFLHGCLISDSGLDRASEKSISA